MYERFLNQYHRKSDVLVHSGQDRYVQIIAERAPLYKDIQVRKEKTIFTSAIVEKLITDEFIFVQFDKNAIMSTLYMIWTIQKHSRK